MTRFGQKQESNPLLYPTDRVFVMHDLEQLPAGTKVDRWPRHCTVIYPFYPTEAFALDALTTAVKDTLDSMPVINACPEDRVYYGPDDTPAVLLSSTGQTFHSEIIESEAIELLHRRLLGSMIGHASYTLSEMIFKNFSPHVTLESDDDHIEPFTVDHLSIAVRDGETGERSIAAVINGD